MEKPIEITRYPEDAKVKPNPSEPQQSTKPGSSQPTQSNPDNPTPGKPIGIPAKPRGQVLTGGPKEPKPLYSLPAAFEKIEITRGEYENICAKSAAYDRVAPEYNDVWSLLAGYKANEPGLWEEISDGGLALENMAFLFRRVIQLLQQERNKNRRMAQQVEGLTNELKTLRELTKEGGDGNRNL